MKLFKRFFTFFLCISIFQVSGVSIKPKAQDFSATVAIDSGNYAYPGETSSITVTAYDWDKIAATDGGYDFRIFIPPVLDVSGVFLNGRQLSSNISDGREYYLVNNEIRFNDYFAAGDKEVPDVLRYTILVTVKPNATSGKYTVPFLKKSMIVDADENIIPTKYVDGSFTVPARDDYIKGDLNGDNRVSGADLILLRKKLLGIDDLQIKEACADVNFDTKTDISDLVALKKYIASAKDRVYLSENGDDRNSGNKDYPVKSLNRALELVSCGGTVEVTDTYGIKKDFNWNHHSKAVNIIGGTVDFTAVEAVRIGDAVTFHDINLNFNDMELFFACGYKTTIGENVAMTGEPQIFGGDTRTVKKTDVTLLSGTYRTIFGGGGNADVTGTVNLYVGGNVNSSVANITNHDRPYLIFGGSNSGYADEVNLEFADNAAIKMLYGGGNGASSYVKRTNVNITGGKLMGIYGGSNLGTCGETNVTMTGGEVEQIFGGNESASMTGNTFVNVLGGRISRRIFGGCYNDAEIKGIFSSTMNWLSSYHVIGTSTVTIGENADITLDYPQSMVDKGISATSRYESDFDDETAVIVFENEAARAKYYSKLGIKGLYSDTPWAGPCDKWYVKQNDR